MNWKLNDSITIIDAKNKYIFLNEEKKISIKKNNKFVELVDVLSNGSKISKKALNNIDNIDILVRNKIIIRDRDYPEDINQRNAKYFENFVDNPEELLKELALKKIFVLGLGGTGQSIIQHLSTAGFRKFVLVDFDKVHKSNFNRQFLADISNIGQLKTEVIKQYLTKNFENVEIEVFSSKIIRKYDLESILGKIEKPDMIVCAADTPPDIINSIVVEEAIEHEITCAFGSVGILIGDVGPILDNKSSKEMYLNYIKNKKSLGVVYNPVLKGSISFTNTLISTLLAQNIMTYYSKHYLTYALNKQILYDMRDMKILKMITF